MSRFNNITDNDLTEKVKLLARNERELTKTIVEHIAEVDRRKLFLARAYSSLFEYLTNEIGYSAGAAQRRIDAARLLQRVPEVAAKIESGAINLAQVSKMQMAARLLRKEGQTVSADMQRFILKKLENKGAEQTDLILAQEFHVPVKVEERRHIQRDESVRIEMTFSKEEMALINRAREILSHKTGGGLKDTVIEMAEKIVKAAQPKIKAHKVSTAGVNATASSVPRNANVTATVEVNGMNLPPISNTMQTKTLTPRLRRDILARDKFCQYRDKITGKLCGATHFLEIDHIQPRFASGSNTADNLRVLCKNHNIYRYRSEL